MFRSMSARGHASQEDTRPARDSDGSADSSWVSLVSRPAWSFLQRYLPGRAQSAFDVKSHLEFGNSLMGGLADPPLKVAYFRCQHENAARVSCGDPGTLAWITHDSLRELGIQSTAQKDFSVQKQAPVGYLGAARNYLSQLLMNASSAQEKRRAGGERGKPEGGCADAVTTRSANSWWGGLWGSEESPQNWLLNVPQSRNETGTNWQDCKEHHIVAYCHGHSLAAIAVTTELCVWRDNEGTIHSESAGPLCPRGQIHNAGLPTAKPEPLINSHQPPPLDDVQKNGVQSLVCSRTFSEIEVLTPDQDNGYFSLEEGHSYSKLCSMRLLSEEQQVSETDGHVASGNDFSQSNAAGSESHSAPVSCKENITHKGNDSELSETEKNAEETSPVSAAAKDPPALPTPQCQNKVIAYIMGSPCSDGSESEDDGDQESDDEDDGFDSEGSSHFSESEDSEDSDDESEGDSDSEDADSETERLWNSLCQNGDPYNPRNFTAPIRTISRPTTAAESSVSESPPAHASSRLSPPPHHPSSPLLSENESSEEACEMDEENLGLWNSFSFSADPYSLLNFQATIQTRKLPKSCRNKASPRTPHYKRKEAEERLDSGFSDVSPVLCSNTVMAAQLKKVQFVEEVEEFYASSDEDRRGPWEEMARDRCRFQRRVQEVEETISYCLSPTFRLDVFQRLCNTS